MSIIAGIILCLTIAFGGSAWMLKNAIEENAVLEDRENNYLQAIVDWDKKYQRLENENKVNEQLIIESNEERDDVEIKLSNATHAIYEIKNTVTNEGTPEFKEHPGVECMAVDMPLSLIDCLQSENCYSESGNKIPVSAETVDS